MANYISPATGKDLTTMINRFENLRPKIMVSGLDPNTTVYYQRNSEPSSASISATTDSNGECILVLPSAYNVLNYEWDVDGIQDGSSVTDYVYVDKYKIYTINF